MGAGCENETNTEVSDIAMRRRNYRHHWRRSNVVQKMLNRITERISESHNEAAMKNKSWLHPPALKFRWAGKKLKLRTFNRLTTFPALLNID